MSINPEWLKDHNGWVVTSEGRKDTSDSRGVRTQLTPAVCFRDSVLLGTLLCPQRAQLDVTRPQRGVTEGPRSPGVGVLVEALVRSHGLTSAGTVMAPVSQCSFNREMKAKFNNPGQHEPA